jgi:hypothetical protein
LRPRGGDRTEVDPVDPVEGDEVVVVDVCRRIRRSTSDVDVGTTVGVQERRSERNITHALGHDERIADLRRSSHDCVVVRTVVDGLASGVQQIEEDDALTHRAGRTSVSGIALVTLVALRARVGQATRARVTGCARGTGRTRITDDLGDEVEVHGLTLHSVKLEASQRRSPTRALAGIAGGVTPGGIC